MKLHNSLLLVALLAARTATAITFTVTSTADSGVGSLLGFFRTIDFSGLPNASGGDGTDIGAVEVQ